MSLSYSRGTSFAPLLLILDDSKDLLTMWQLLLEASGFRVITAASGLAALEQAKQHRPDLVITDYMMPGMDGRLFCRNLKADPLFRTTPVILWTAAIAAIDDSCFDRLMRKPVLLEELIEEIWSLLEDITPVHHEEPRNS